MSYIDKWRPIIVAHLASAWRISASALAAFYGWLDWRFFPTFQRVVTHRLFILSLLILGVVLMVDDSPIIQLKGGNFTNVCSAVLGCVVLLQQMAHHKSIKDLHRKVDALAEGTPPYQAPPSRSRKKKETTE
jgi:hypothetical protein